MNRDAAQPLISISKANDDASGANADEVLPIDDHLLGSRNARSRSASPVSSNAESDYDSASEMAKWNDPQLYKF